MPVVHIYVFLEKMFIRVLCPFLTGLFISCWVVWVLIFLDFTLYQIYHLQISFTFSRLSFICRWYHFLCKSFLGWCSSVQLLSRIWLFVTPWTAACQAPRPSPTPRVYPNSCPLSRWCHLTISSSVIPFSSCLQSFPTSGSFKWVSALHQVAKILEFQLQNQSFQWTPRTDLL